MKKTRKKTTSSKTSLVANEVNELHQRVADLEARESRHQHTEEKVLFQSQLLDSVRESIVATDLEGRVIYWGKGAEALYGYPASEVMGKPITFIVEPHNEENERERMQQVREKGIWGGQYVQRRRDGSHFWADTIISLVKDQRGQPCGLIGIDRDITDRKKAEQELRETKQKYESLVQNIPDAIYSCLPDENATPVFVSQRWHKWTGYSPEEFYSDPDVWTRSIHPEDSSKVFEVLSGAFANKQPYDLEYRIVHKDTGEVRVLRNHGMPVVDQRGRILRYEGIATEITERKRAEEALVAQAIRDSLTNLYNRRYFDSRMEEEIGRADRNGYSIAFILGDLDRFKTINDTRGHHVGDDILEEVAKGILESTRGADLVFRWGGDEFVVVLPHVSREGALIAAERIRRGVKKAGGAVYPGLDISLGITFYPEHGRNVEDLVRAADQALYVAKQGREKVHIGLGEEYRVIESPLKVVFQPIMDVQPVAAINSSQILGYEALSRDPEGKLSILELFKKYKGIGRLQELKCKCFRDQLRVAQGAGIQRLFINVDFEVLGQLESVPKPPGMVVILEISELEVLDNIEDRLQIAQKWREHGYKFAIDDFGAGFISLPFIARLIPEYIKVDRSTILQAVSSEQFKEFLSGLVFALRKYCSEGIIAEGIETQEELKVLEDIPIFLVQGFLFGQPQEMK